MKWEERAGALSELGNQLRQLPEEARQAVFKKAWEKNPWFTPDNVQLAFHGACAFLEKEKLINWMSKYLSKGGRLKTVGVAMAGNIPLVGFHDYLCVLSAGHRAQVKLSSQDAELLPFVHGMLARIEPRFADAASFEERLHGYDAAIATGSDNTGRYFSYYFKNVPHIIRKNRASCAVLLGGETPGELEALGNDVFQYFGLGCRNVSKLYIPEEYDLIPLLKEWEKFSPLVHHNKYANNYNYQRSIHLTNRLPFYDNGAILLVESNKLVSPIAVVYYERYSDQKDLQRKVGLHREKLQCVLSAKGWFKGSIEFGKAQKPELEDYADNVDTMGFLTAL
ncbi:MAG: acyl-CoA reductase [Cyclobacteriaceae bacterium]|nr:acyl-CoA reductase [Flammeovirgaceae bacterium]MCO5271445.1 acyl-CoA reductase [Cyclobacteriaceae bacterium]MCW5903624.1 acyl-CoA reductase [Cyclobacteriaceae bacterium]HPI78995.1 acyl-CoA reductase [Cyclobacteriaceae bacterium]